MNMKNLAFEIASSAHAGQVDKGGEPYIKHPIAVASKFPEDDPCYIVALLHDTVEDSELTLNGLSARGFSQDIIDAVGALTKREGEPYADYLHRVKTNNLACAVKIEDLRHNSDLSRLNNPSEKDLARVEKYKQALKSLVLNGQTPH